MIDYALAQTELVTLRDWLRWMTSRFNEVELFFGHGNSDAFNEASQLLLHSLSLPVTALPENLLDAKLTSEEKEHLVALIKQRIEYKTPLPYITGEAWFAGLPFFVDDRVLIPRSPFAELIANEFAPWLPEDKPVTRIMDMCTGSGCIAIALALAFEDADVDAVDISEDALDVAALNVDKYALDGCVQLIQSDIWENVPEEQYDLIISNPPYVGADEMAELPDEYRHEPTFALEAEKNGLALVERILLQAADYLADDGLLFVEVGNSDLAVEETWPDTPFTWIDFENGGHGIFMLDKAACLEFQQQYGA